MPAVTSDDLELWLAGLGPYVEAATGGDSGRQQRLYDLAIAAAHRRFEEELQVAIDKRVIKMAPDPSLVKGRDYDEEEAPLDYISGQISTQRLPRFHLRRRAITLLHRVARSRAYFFTTFQNTTVSGTVSSPSRLSRQAEGETYWPNGT